MSKTFYINYCDGLGYCVSYRAKLIATTAGGDKIYAAPGRASNWYSTKKQAQVALKKLAGAQK